MSSREKPVSALILLRLMRKGSASKHYISHKAEPAFKRTHHPAQVFVILDISETSVITEKKKNFSHDRYVEIKKKKNTLNKHTNLL